MKHKCKPGSPASILMGHSHEHHHEHHEHRKHHADGGEAMPNMPTIGARREEPNMHQRFKRGGRAMGGAMQMEDKLKAEGTYGSRGSEMDKENHKRACGGGLKRKYRSCLNPHQNLGTAWPMRPRFSKIRGSVPGRRLLCAEPTLATIQPFPGSGVSDGIMKTQNNTRRRIIARRLKPMANSF